MIHGPAQADKNHTLKIVLAFAAIYIIWGTTYLVIRIAIETVPPFFMAGTRFLLAGILLFTLLRLRGVPLPRRLHWRSAFIVGALLIVGGSGLLTWSEQQVPSSTAALVVATVPLWIALFDWLIFKGPRPDKRVTLGLAFGFLGIALLVGPGQILGTSGFSLLALLVLLMSPILWSFGSLYSRQIALPDNPFMTTASELLAGGVLLLLAGLLTGEASQLDISAVSTRSLAAMLYLMIFGSLIGFTSYIWLLQHVQATRVATYTYVNPVIAVFLGWLIAGETITPTTIAAIVIIVLAVVLITTSPPGKTPGAEEITPAGEPLAG